jgi:hypothetical protein
MKRLLPSLIIGLLVAIVLLAAGFLLSQHPSFSWLSQLAYVPGDRSFPYFSHSGLLAAGELRHHSFVLVFSLISW